MKKQKQPMKPQTKLGLLQAGSVVSLVAPVLTVVGINWNDYFSVGAYSGVRLSLGGMLALVITILMVKGKSEILKGIWGYLIVFLMAVFLKPVVDDLVLLTGMALAGKSIDVVFFERFVKKLRKQIDQTEQADITAKGLEKAVEKIISGRV